MKRRFIFNKKRTCLLLGMISIVGLLTTGCSNNKSEEINIPELKTKVEEFDRVEKVLDSSEDKDGNTVYDFYSNEKERDYAIQFIGTTLNDLSLQKEDGTLFNLSDIKTPIVLEFASSSCSACIKSIPVMEAAPDKYPDVTFLTVVKNNEKEQRDGFKKNGYSHEIYLLNDGMSKEDFSAQGYPFFLLLDKNLEVQMISSGSMTDNILNILIQRSFN